MSAGAERKAAREGESSAGAGRRPAREAVLAEIRAALAPPAAAKKSGYRSLGPQEGEKVEVPTFYRRRGGRDRAAVLSLFAERCRDYGSGVALVPRERLGEAIGAALAAAGVGRVAIPADVPAAWRAAAAEWVEDDGLGVAELDAVDGALTGCAAAIAETGTLVLDGGARQGRRALTLVPDFHLCVIGADQIVELVPEALERVRPSAAAGRPLTFVSGCSATSDIELERVAGVHGPRTLSVLVVDPSV